MSSDVTWLRVPCTDCGDGLEFKLPLSPLQLDRQANELGWFCSVLSHSDKLLNDRLVVGLLCPKCAPKVYPAGVLDAARTLKKASKA